MTTGLAVGAVASLDRPLGRRLVAPRRTTISLQGASYTPKAAAGGTDDYHCTLINPHVTKNSYIVSAHFYPNSVEVHHAILFLIPPNLAAQARADDKSGKGWTCFGESALPGTASLRQISNTPWLTAWAPGHGAGRRAGRAPASGCRPAASSSSRSTTTCSGATSRSGPSCS